MKNKVLLIRRKNWGLIESNTWKEQQWIIFDDLSVDYSITYDSTDNNKITKNFEISKENFDTIIKELELSKTNNTIVNACDGVAWEYIEYENNLEIWKRKLGYIYGIESLEKIGYILIHELKLF